MSEIITDTITGKSTATTITIGSTPVVSSSANSMTIRGEGSAQTSIQQGLAKAWVNFNGTSTLATRDSYNISSVTDNDTGTYTPNFTSDMNNASYTTTLVCGDDMNNTTLHNALVQTGSYRIHNKNDSNAFADSSVMMTNVHGDLA